MSLKQFLTLLIVPVLFMLLSFKNIPDYGVNWDDAMHYNRGNAYLYYFLTQKENYADFPKHQPDESVDFKDIRGNYMNLYKDAKKTDGNLYQKRSYYQSDVFNFEYFKTRDSGHPPINGILAAFTNYIFFQKLGIISDLDSYKIAPIIISTYAIFAVSLFAFYTFGLFPAIVSALSFSLYPLFFSETQFNIKDPVLTSFFSLTIVTFYFAITKNKIWLCIMSFIFAGFALGTKFNALFLPVILLPWLVLYNYSQKKSIWKVFKLLPLALIPFLVLFLFWPYLWFNGLDGWINIFSYYKSEGLGSIADTSNYIFLGLNFFPISWIVITTPLTILFISLIGLYYLLRNSLKSKNHAFLLILLWFFIPIIRVTLPDTIIYGGVRHIMEFIPALSLFAAAGSFYILKFLPKYQLSIILMILLLFSFTTLELYSIHPNENIYFNQIIGGLSGAKDHKIPYWGNSFGNSYLQGINWINKNAEFGASLGLPVGGTVNLPRQKIRSDINLSNDNFSAFAKKGEYEIEMFNDSFPKDFFSYEYLENFLNPVYELKIDGVAILKVWKNDAEHTKKGYLDEKEIAGETEKTENTLRVSLRETSKLTRLYLTFNNEKCARNIDGQIYISDDGKSWKIQKDPISYPQMNLSKINAENFDFVYLFAGKPAKYIKLELMANSACLLNNPQLKIFGLDSKSSQ